MKPRCKQSFKGIGVLCWSDCSVHPVYKADCNIKYILNIKFSKIY